MTLEQEASQQRIGHEKNDTYVNTVLDFLQDGPGCFITLTDDQVVLAMLRDILADDLGLTPQGFLHTVPEASLLFRELDALHEDGFKPLLIIERRYNGIDMSLRIEEYKRAFPNMLVLLLTADLEPHMVVYLHELGADNLIVKPVSTQTIIEKLAYTLRPQGRLEEYIEAAKTMLEEGLLKQAGAMAAKILEIKPGSAAGLLILGDVELAEGRLEAAKAAYLEAAENAALYLEPLRRLASLAEKAGRPAEALDYLEQLDKLSPLNINRKIAMGKVNLTLGDEERAAELFATVMTQAHKEAIDRISAVAERIAEVYENMHPEQSEIFLRKALGVKKQLTLEDLHVFNKLGISLRRRGQWQAAITEYKRALHIAPQSGQLYYNIGMAYAQGERLIDARANLQKAIELNARLPYTSAAAAYNMGMVFKKTADQANARKCFQAALEQNPGMCAAAQELQEL